VFEKLKKAYINFTVTFTVPILILNAINSHYWAWWERKLDQHGDLVSCRRLADKGVGSREECQKEWEDRYLDFVAEDIIEKELWDPLYNHISMEYVQPIQGWWYRRTGDVYKFYKDSIKDGH